VTQAALFLVAMLAAPTPTAPVQAAAPGAYANLWTRWSGVNADSLAAEARAAPPASAAGPLRAGSPELGQRVGEEVRSGNCAEGERLARAAGDFPLLEAVRAHCRSGAVQAVSRR
jgi:hypothetical protein